MPPKKTVDVEAQIDDFLAIAQTSRDHARHHLQKQKGNIQLAVNDHFDGTHCLKDSPTLENNEETSATRRTRENNNDDDDDDDHQNNNNNNMMMMMGNNNNQQEQQEGPSVPSNEAAAAATTVRGRGGRGRGRGRGVAAAPRRTAAKKRTADDSTSSEDIGSSSSSSDDDSNGSGSGSGNDDDESSSDETPKRGRGRGRGARGGRVKADAAASTGRGRGRGAAAASKKKKKQKDSSDSDSNSDDNNNDDDADGNNNNNNNNNQRAIGEETRATREFKQLAAIPFRTATEDRARFDANVNNEDALKRSLLELDTNWKTLHRNCQVRGYWARHETVSDPIGFLDAPDISFNTLIMTDFVASPANLRECPCLLTACNYSDYSTKREVVKSAFGHKTLLVLADQQDTSQRYVPSVGNPGTLILRRGVYYFERTFGTSVIHKSEDKDPENKYRYEANVWRAFEGGIPVFIIPENVTTNQEVQECIDQQIAGTKAQSLMRRWRLQESRRERNHPIIIDAKKEFLGEHDDQNKTHAFHHLFLRLRALEANYGGDWNNPVRTNLRALGDTRDRVWKRRFVIDNVARCFPLENNQVLKTEMPIFDNLYRDILTPEALFAVAKEFQAKSAKDIFEFYGNELVRINTDVRPVPVRPRGITVDLFPHQRRTVAFMLDRERIPVQQFVHSNPIPLPPTAAIFENGGPVQQGKYTHYRYHINSAFGAFVVTPVGSPADIEIMSNGKHRGGILADEVGMGKTLSILSLILLNPASYETHYIKDGTTPIRASLPKERPLTDAEKVFKESLSTKLKIRGTLVLAPVSLVGQWEEEIRKRAPGMKILRFHGAEKKKRLTYADFAAADIVITTFETYRLTLRDEAFWFKWYATYSDDLGGHCLRNPPDAVLRPQLYRDLVTKTWTMRHQFRSLGKNVVKDGQRPTPDTVFLSRLHFHRIVADEFHKQGGISNDTTLIDSDNLWLVSGTPLDAPIGRFMKRLGVMDFSFVDADQLRFVADSGDEGYASHYERSVFQRQFYVDKKSDIRPIWDPELEKRLGYKPPPQAPCNYARLAFLSQYMIRNTVNTCPELASVRVTEKIIKLNHSAKEAERYAETLENVRTELTGMQARGTLQTRILYVLTLLNNLRRAAVDPFGVTVNVRDAFAVVGGAQFGNENERRNIHLVPVNIFAHLVYPNDFPLNVGLDSDGAAVSATDRAFAHVKSVTQSGTLKEELTAMLKDPPEVEACMICLENLAQPTAVSCGHIFCRECILQWIQRGMSSNCPACRKDSLGDNKKKSLLTFPPPPKDNVKEEPGLKKDENDDDDEDAVDPVAARVPTKIKKVMAIIREAIAEDETSKFLVFTAFPSVLRFLQEELARASIGSVIIDGSSTLTQRADRVKQFQEIDNIDTRVCIVSSRVGNMGLTLTAANHLIIVEPASNIDVDTQILGRVKRLGQKRAVTCHRLLVEDSIEIALHDLVQARTVSLSASGSEAAKKAVTDTIMKLVYPQVANDNEEQNDSDGDGEQGSDDDDDQPPRNNDDDEVAAPAAAAAAAAAAGAGNNNNQQQQGADGLNDFEREQMEQIARWERQYGNQ